MCRPEIGKKYITIFTQGLEQLCIYTTVTSHGIDIVSSKAHMRFYKDSCIESNDMPISYKGSALGSALILASKRGDGKLITNVLRFMTRGIFFVDIQRHLMQPRNQCLFQSILHPSLGEFQTVTVHKLALIIP